MSSPLPALLRQVASLGHKVFTGDSYDMNLVAQRGPERRAGQMDDLLSVCYRERGVWLEDAFPCSVDPGVYFLKNLMNPNGAAIIAPGQYRGAYELGKHKGREALVQVAPVTVRRDGDRDEILEPGQSETGPFGLNIHDDAGAGANASAGCIVLSVEHERTLLSILRLQVPKWGPRFSLTVIELP